MIFRRYDKNLLLLKIDHVFKYSFLWKRLFIYVLRMYRTTLYHIFVTFRRRVWIGFIFLKVLILQLLYDIVFYTPRKTGKRWIRIRNNVFLVKNRHKVLYRGTDIKTKYISKNYSKCNNMQGVINKTNFTII